MIELYTWPTPNGQKVHIALEEMGIDYRAHPVDITRGEQFEPEFLRISPNNRIPAIVDRDRPDEDGFPLFESGAILIYLAERSGQYFPEDPVARYRTLEWLMFQMGNVGPMFGQCGHFVKFAPERVDYGIDRYSREVRRLLRVLDARLEQAEWLAGDAYTIADMATYPWIRSATTLGVDLRDYAAVHRWVGAVGERPAVGRGMALLQDQAVAPEDLDHDAREALFGAGQECR